MGYAYFKISFQSLLGKLLYIHKFMVPAHTFINRMLALFRQNSTKRCIALTEKFHKDLSLFLLFLPKFNGITYIQKPDIPGGQTLRVDASVTDLGGV